MKSKIIKKSNVKLGKCVEIYSNDESGSKLSHPQTLEEDRREIILKDLEKEVNGIY